MYFENKEWKLFKYSEIFDIFSGYYNKKPIKESVENKIPFIGASSFNNGITDFISINDVQKYDKVGVVNNNLNKKIFEGNSLTISNNGSIGYAFYQKNSFTCSHDVYVVYIKHNLKMTENIGIFLMTLIAKDRYRWNYGRKQRAKKFYESTILLPINNKTDPDWAWMDYVVRMNPNNTILNIKKTVEKKLVQLPEIKDWKDFRYVDLFRILKGKRLTKENSNHGNTVYLSSKDSNNNFDRLIDLDPIYHKNTLTVNSNGSVGSAFYHEYEYWASDNTNVLIPKFYLNKYIGLFLTTIIEKEKYRFGYGRLWNTARMNNTILRLPVTNLGEPDWNLMELYIKSLPYSEYI